MAQGTQEVGRQVITLEVIDTQERAEELAELAAFAFNASLWTNVMTYSVRPA